MKLPAACLLAAFALAGSTFHAAAESRAYMHSGCTKDGIEVSEEIFWDCKGSCATTSLKTQIMTEAKASRGAYPAVVRGFTKTQISSGSHRGSLVKRAKIKSGLTSNAPRFGGKC